jgi:uncharacterized protein (DUF427 family)
MNSPGLKQILRLLGTMSNLPSIDALMPRLITARARWGTPPPPGVIPEVPGADQESVWDYPRPPEVRSAETTIRAYWGKVLVMETDQTLRIVETAGAPVYYAPAEAWQPGVLIPNGQYSICEWKGIATQFDLVVGNERVSWAAFSYENPLTDLGMGYERVAGWIASHPAKLVCYLGEEQVMPQPGGLYAGWISSRVVGPFKGNHGTEHW